MGFGAVFATIMFIFVFASAAVFVASMQRSMQHSATVQQQKHLADLKVAGEAITITSSTYSYAAVDYWTDRLYSDFILGTVSNAVVNSSGVMLSGPSYSDGTYTSQAIDSGFAATNYTTLSWTSVEPLGTSIEFQARAGADNATLNAASFTGPDGTAGSFYTVSGSVLNSTLNGKEFIQYRAYLDTTDNALTPALQEVQLGVQRPTGDITLNVTNTGSEALLPFETDVYTPLRVPRNVTKRTLVLADAGNQASWDPGESLQIVVFQSIAGMTQVKVANSAATAATVVGP